MGGKILAHTFIDLSLSKLLRDYWGSYSNKKLTRTSGDCRNYRKVTYRKRSKHRSIALTTPQLYTPTRTLTLVLNISSGILLTGVKMQSSMNHVLHWVPICKGNCSDLDTCRRINRHALRYHPSHGETTRGISFDRRTHILSSVTHLQHHGMSKIFYATLCCSSN